MQTHRKRKQHVKRRGVIIERRVSVESRIQLDEKGMSVGLVRHRKEEEKGMMRMTMDSYGEMKNGT